MNEFQGQGQECSRPRIQDTTRKCFSKQKNFINKIKKRSSPTNLQIFHKIQASKIIFRKFSNVLQDKTTLLIILAHFQQAKKKCCSRTKDRAFSRTCRVRGQGRDLRGQGPQIVFLTSRTSWKTPFLLTMLSISNLAMRRCVLEKDT